MSLRRLRYQLRCAAAGHDTRPQFVNGSTVEHRCLRCGALVGEPEPAASSAHGPSAPGADGDGPQLAGLPPAVALEDPPQDDELDEDDGGVSALHALRELGELHAAGVLTEAEFAAKKAELLRRV